MITSPKTHPKLPQPSQATIMESRRVPARSVSFSGNQSTSRDGNISAKIKTKKKKKKKKKRLMEIISESHPN